MNHSTTISTSTKEHARNVGLASKSFHKSILLVAIAIIAAAALLSVPDAGQVSLPMELGTLPVLCPVKLLTSVNCAGCGLTRSFVCIAHGEWNRAWHFHPAGFVIFLSVASQIPYRVFLLRCLRRRQIAPRWLLRMSYVSIFICGIALVATWFSGILEQLVL